MGLEFYADFKSTSDATHYKWDWENTFILNQIRDLDDPQKCYVTEPSNGFVNILKNESFAFVYENYPVKFVPVNFKFNYKYSTNIFLYSMSDSASEFWNQVYSQLNIKGSIFDPAPTIISGNIQNINDSKEVVLGYFGAFGKSEKRVFIDNPEAGVLVGLGNFTYMRNETCFITGPSPRPRPPEWCFNCIYHPGSQSEKPDFWED
jgi:hypothetical protein